MLSYRSVRIGLIVLRLIDTSNESSHHNTAIQGIQMSGIIFNGLSSLRPTATDYFLIYSPITSTRSNMPSFYSDPYMHLVNYSNLFL